MLMVDDWNQRQKWKITTFTFYIHELFPQSIVILSTIQEKEMATHCSILAWRIPWTKEPDGLQSMGSQRVGHDWVTSTFPFTRPVWPASKSWERKGHRHREDYAKRRQRLERCCHRPRNVWGHKKLEGRGLQGGLRGTMALLTPWFWTSRL